MTDTVKYASLDDQFGVCPDCGDTDGYINVGRGHWFYCVAHKVCWCVGSNLFSSWRYETEDEQRARYHELGFGSFRHLDDEEEPPCTPS